MGSLYELIKPVLFKLDPEDAHNYATKLGQAVQAVPNALSLVEETTRFEDGDLATKYFRREFRNPVGLAAGADKQGLLVDLWYALGFGHIDVGSVTANPCKGNDLPRLFRLPKDEALINRMGLNGPGSKVVYRNIRNSNQIMNSKFPVGVNITKTPGAKNGVNDFLISYMTNRGLADFITLNVSCPNHATGKLYEDPRELDLLLDAVTEDRKHTPTGVKFSPNISDADLEHNLELCISYDMDFVVLTNTATTRDNLLTPQSRLDEIGNGGLSGKPLRVPSNEVIAKAYNLLDGRLPVFGVGGVDSGKAAYEKILAGASLVQLYSGLVFKGPRLVRNINEYLLGRVVKDNWGNISEAVGQGRTW